MDSDLSVNNKSIVVLPFVNMSGDMENEYFSDGITEEIINALTTVKGLKVIARTSSFAFKNKNIDVRTIGKQLGVSTVLEGSVRKAENRVRITAQLINTEDGTHFWSKNFDRYLDDIFLLQDEISLRIANQIRENFGHLDIQEHLVEAPTHNTEAYDLYLQARYQHLLWDGQGIRNSVELYEQCVALDPTFAWPYFGLAYSYAMYGSWGNNKELLQVAATHLNKGFKLDKQSYLGYFSKATLAFWGHWEFVNGCALFRQAIALNPAYTEAEEGLCELYTAIGYFDKAHWHADNMLKKNPLSANHYFTKANIHYLNNEYTKALDCIETSLSIQPDFTHSIVLKQLCFVLLKEYEKLDQYIQQTELAENPDECRALYQLLHPEEQVNIDLSTVSISTREGIGAALIPWQLFLLVHMGQHEMALDFLEENIKTRSGQVINFMNIPFLQPLHNSERFNGLVQSVFGSELLPQKSEEPLQLAPPKVLMTETEINAVLSLLEKGMNEEKWYKTPSLSLQDLAKMVNLNTNKLSWLLNEQLGQNFNDYLNSFRLANFKIDALNPENRHLTLLGLAHENGFNSKTVFNAYFKKNEGTTPKNWLKSKQGKSN